MFNSRYGRLVLTSGPFRRGAGDAEGVACDLDAIPVRPWCRVPVIACDLCSGRATSVLERYRCSPSPDGKDLSVPATPRCEEHWEQTLGDLLAGLSEADEGSHWAVGTTSLRSCWMGWFLEGTSLGRQVARSPLTLCWAPGDAPSDDLGVALVWRQQRLRSTKPGRSFSLTFEALNRLNII